MLHHLHKISFRLLSRRANDDAMQATLHPPQQLEPATIPAHQHDPNNARLSVCLRIPLRAPATLQMDEGRAQGLDGIMEDVRRNGSQRFSVTRHSRDQNLSRAHLLELFDAELSVAHGLADAIPPPSLMRPRTLRFQPKKNDSPSGSMTSQQAQEFIFVDRIAQQLRFGLNDLQNKQNSTTLRSKIDSVAIELQNSHVLSPSMRQQIHNLLQSLRPLLQGHGPLDLSQARDNIGRLHPDAPL